MHTIGVGLGEIYKQTEHEEEKRHTCMYKFKYLLLVSDTTRTHSKIWFIFHSSIIQKSTKFAFTNHKLGDMKEGDDISSTQPSVLSPAQDTDVPLAVERNMIIMTITNIFHKFS